MNSLHYRLMMAHLTMKKRVSDGTRELGLTPGQPKVLDFLSENDGADQTAIATGCFIDKATIGGILERMERAGFISRQRGERDRRSIMVTLTPKGWEMAAAARAAFAQAEQPVHEVMSEEEIDQLVELLSKVQTILEHRSVA